MSYEKLFQSEVNGDAVKAWQAQGKKALGVLCCHLPEEILYAADVLPVRMRATGCKEYDAAEMWMSTFSCTFAKSVLQYWIDGKYQLDLWECNRRVLVEAGVQEDNIAISNICTCCNPSLLFSHRASHGKRGNLGAFMFLK